MSHEHNNRDLNRFIVSADVKVSLFWQTRKCLIVVSADVNIWLLFWQTWMFDCCFVRHVNVSLLFWQTFRCFIRHVDVSLLFWQTFRCFIRHVNVSLLFQQTCDCFLVLADMFHCCFGRHVNVSLFWQTCESSIVVSADMCMFHCCFGRSANVSLLFRQTCECLLLFRQARLCYSSHSWQGWTDSFWHQCLRIPWGFCCKLSLLCMLHTTKGD